MSKSTDCSWEIRKDIHFTAPDLERSIRISHFCCQGIPGHTEISCSYTLRKLWLLGGEAFHLARVALPLPSCSLWLQVCDTDCMGNGGKSKRQQLGHPQFSTTRVLQACFLWLHTEPFVAAFHTDTHKAAIPSWRSLVPLSKGRLSTDLFSQCKYLWK